MADWPRHLPADAFAPIEGRQAHHLEVFLKNGQLADVRLDGASVLPTWFKIEWKETGEMSAKVKGVRLATRYGDRITFHTT
jgi:hypothetical protein